jgi:hypothetical protein
MARNNELKHMMGQLTQRIQQDYFLALTDDDLKYSDIDELIKDNQGAYYSEITSDTRGALELRTRGIQIVQPEKSTAAELADSHLQRVPVATDTCFIVSHARER